MTENFYDLDELQQSQRLTRLARHALSLWEGEFDQVELIKYRENAVFSVVRDDGFCAALRVHRFGYHSDDELHSELCWIEALKGAGIEVPQIVPSGSGQKFVTAKCAGVPEPRQVDMLTWLGGSPLGSIEDESSLVAGDLTQLYFAAGQLAARVHNHATSWRIPSEFKRHAWDAEGLVGDSPLWGRFWELEALTHDQRELLGRARLKLWQDLRSYGQHDGNYSLIHADFVPENLFVEQGRLKLIDFDDSGFGWHMFELATALYFHLDQPYYPALEEALFSGYETLRPLGETQRRACPMFLLLRSLTYLGWVHTRHETATAREFTPMFVDRTCALAAEYLR